ncbi:MAG: cob(I)yrinic acid a,c-diamide adenosyltransferase [Candidatus Brocadiia bacterium]
MSEQPPKGRILILAGDGKGKTTSALGTALRAAGHGMRVLIVQFVKGRPAGEHVALDRLDADVETRLCGTGFIDPDAPGLEAGQGARSGLQRAAAELAGGTWDMVVLDEALYALRLGLFEAGALRSAVTGRADGVHVILTGNGPYRELADLADTITEMRNVRHAHEEGVPPTAGIEL